MLLTDLSWLSNSCNVFVWAYYGYTCNVLSCGELKTAFKSFMHATGTSVEA